VIFDTVWRDPCVQGQGQGHDPQSQD